MVVTLTWAKLRLYIPLVIFEFLISIVGILILGLHGSAFSKRNRLNGGTEANDRTLQLREAAMKYQSTIVDHFNYNMYIIFICTFLAQLFTSARLYSHISLILGVVRMVAGFMGFAIYSTQWCIPIADVKLSGQTIKSISVETKCYAKEYADIVGTCIGCLVVAVLCLVVTILYAINMVGEANLQQESTGNPAKARFAESKQGKQVKYAAKGPKIKGD